MADDGGPPPTKLYLPHSLRPLYPIVILQLHQKNHLPVQVKKTQPLFTYSYDVKVKRPDPSSSSNLSGTDGTTDSQTRKMIVVVEKEVKVWETPVDGFLVKYNIKEGQVLTLEDGLAHEVLQIREPCTHDVQLHGLCALCGKDLTVTDYTGFSDTSRAEISMVHDVGGLTVSLEEANRLETQTTSRLLSACKLSLIVDLDQTIVHATVDPTVGEWLQDPSNPNYGALKGVERFRLGNGTDERTEDGCWYYVKQRPGLVNFLKTVSESYEMHVYTMGTRAYASAVCKIIDPDGGLFGGRILSRDESGSMTRKSLQRLFPCDTSMVVIIDDRADVWDGSPNLVKVIPYEFFVGIGDINAAFLPKKKELAAAPPDSPASLAASSNITTGLQNRQDVSTSDSSSTFNPLNGNRGLTVSDDLAPSDIEVSPSSAIDPNMDSTIISPSLSEASASTAITIHDQIENRPLSKTQAQSSSQILLKHHSSSSSSTNSEAESGGFVSKEESQSEFSIGSHENEHGVHHDSSKKGNASQEEKDDDDDEEDDDDDKSTSTEEEEVREYDAVLRDDDDELNRVLAILQSVHQEFFENQSTKSSADVKTIIPNMKQRTLQGLSLVFSGLIALGARPSDSEYWRLATTFGAHCSVDFTPSTTHLVASQGGTAKVYRARKSGDHIHVVWSRWLLNSTAQWARQDEKDYQLDDPPSMTGTETPNSLTNSSGTALLTMADEKTDDTGVEDNESDTTNTNREDPEDDFIGEDDALPQHSMAASGSSAGAGDLDSLHFDFPDDEEGATPAYDDDVDVNATGALDIDWGDAAAEVDDFLNETDDDDDINPYASIARGAAQVNSSEFHNDLDSAEGSHRLGKRPRTASTISSSTSTDSESENHSLSRPMKNGLKKQVSSKSGRTTAMADAEAGLGSPLSKRVKTSRSRQSKLPLKVSFPSSDASKNDQSELKGKPLGKSTAMASNEAAGITSPRPEITTTTTSSSVDSDDEAFFASMAAEVEKGLS